MQSGATGQEAGGTSILDLLLGAKGEPDQVIKAGRAIADKLVKPVRAGLEEAASEPVAVEIEAVEVDRMIEFLAGAGPHDALTSASSPISPDALSIRIDPQAVAIFVSALFGAEPEQGIGGIARNLSPVELEVSNLVCRLVATAFNGAHGPGQKLKLPLPPVLSGDGLKEAAVRDGPAVRIDFAIGPEGSSGRMSLFLPQRVVLRRGDEAASADPAAAEAESAEWAARFNEEVMRARITLEATMPVGRMTLGAIAALRRGQVIELSRTAPTETRLSARNKLLFVCEFGRLDENYTVRIRKPVEESEDLIEGLMAP
jgi:flagellar motor switch protein FliM